MITVRQIERQWETKTYDRLLRDLLAARREGTLRLGVDVAQPLCAAAMAIIRLDELSQSRVKLYSKLVKVIVAAQEADGGWGDLPTTALCLRALLCGNGGGVAVERGLKYLSDLQKSDGIWPNIPIRRMPADPYVSALILYQLADQPKFRQAMRIADAANWFAANEAYFDDETRHLWKRARIRGRLFTSAQQPSLC